MRQEEKQLLVSRLPWFALALFLVFFAYGELHELEHKVKTPGNQTGKQLCSSNRAEKKTWIVRKPT